MDRKRLSVIGVLVSLCVLVFVQGGESAMPKQTVELWSAHSAQKVKEDEPKPGGASSALSIRAARNEFEAAQLVISSSSALDDLKISVGNLKRESGGTISHRNVEIRYATYVPLPFFKTSMPDPLPPLKSLRLEAGKNLPVFFIVHVPRNARAGTYQAPVRIHWDGGEAQTTLSLTVWDFSLPLTPTCVTAFGYNFGDHILRLHGLKSGSPEAEKMLLKYVDMMLDYKLSPFKVPVPYESRTAKKFFEDPRLTSYVVDYSDKGDELEKRIALLKAKKWWEKGYFYVQDEPVDAKQYEVLHQTSQRIKRIAPDARIVSPFFSRPAIDNTKTMPELAGEDVNIWCIASGYYNEDEKVREQVHQKQREGQELWWYVCCGPGSPYCNFFVQLSGMEHRMLFWQMRQHGIEGLLYWCTTWWEPDQKLGSGDDPWTDMATVKNINPNIYGDGSLFYPGQKVGVDGPVPSQRMLVIRDGIDDFEYLALLEKKCGRGAAEDAIGELVKSLTDYSKDPAQLEKVRTNIAERISGN